ncbi:MAG: hypothetical protein JWN29_3248 [Acidimicrobiales bacterium]|nr:hypothetical protein [Acidimicrobiales bacterium]
MADLFFDREATPPGGSSPLPPKRSRTGRWLTVLAVVAALVVVPLGSGAFWVKGKVDPPGGPGTAVSVDVPKGASTSAIAELLETKQVITDARVFKLYLKFTGGGPFEAGLYRLHEKSSMGDVVTTMEGGPALPAAENLTIPEALVLEQVAQRVGRIKHLDSATFLAAAKSGDVRSKYQPAGQLSLEGLLFPDTYRIEDKEDELGVLARMVGTFDDVAGSLGYDQAKQKVGYTPYQTIIVASLVEAEAKDDADRAKIARVIYNRLEKKMPLGIDATFYFALPLDRRGTALRKSDLDRPGPYNTRKNVGLVPTPVALPGKASLEAALNPAPGDWLYYVLKDERTHAFSSDYNQFLRDKQAAQQKGLIP